MIKHLYPNLGWAQLPAWKRNAIKVSDGKLFIDLAKEQVEDVLLVNSDVILMEEVKAQSPRGILTLPVEKVDNIMTVAGDIVDYRSAASF